MKYAEVCPGIYQIGGSGFPNGSDCCVYLLDGGGKYALIDCGAGSETQKIWDNLIEIANRPEDILFIIVTHGHIDHIGGISYLHQALPQAKIVAHRLELAAIEEGQSRLTAADWYGVKYSGVSVDLALEKENEVLEIGGMKLNCLHTPGHTPGGISPYLDWQGRKILFGQDIHGPFSKQWGSDMQHWKQSMQALLALKADILCEGHFGIIKPNSAVQDFINGYVRQYS